MKKIKVLLSLIMMITMLISFSLPVYAAEIEYSDHGGMVMTKGYNPFGSDGNTKSIIGSDDLNEYSALKVDDSIKTSIGVQDDQTVIRIHNMPIFYAFGNCDSIEEIFKSEYINESCYIVMDGTEPVAVYKAFNDKLYLMDITNTTIPYDYNTRTVLMSENILEKLPQNAHVLDIYYLWGRSNHQGSALYYKTDLGDFVYYTQYSVGGKQYLFPASEFFDLMKKVFEDISNPENSDLDGYEINIESIQDVSRYDIDSSEFDLGLPAENKSMFMRALPWLSAAVVISGGGAVLFWIKKRRKLSKKSL